MRIVRTRDGEDDEPDEFVPDPSEDFADNVLIEQVEAGSIGAVKRHRGAKPELLQGKRGSVAPAEKFQGGWPRGSTTTVVARLPPMLTEMVFKMVSAKNLSRGDDLAIGEAAVVVADIVLSGHVAAVPLDTSKDLDSRAPPAAGVEAPVLSSAAASSQHFGEVIAEAPDRLPPRGRVARGIGEPIQGGSVLQQVDGEHDFPSSNLDTVPSITKGQNAVEGRHGIRPEKGPRAGIAVSDKGVLALLADLGVEDGRAFEVSSALDNIVVESLRPRRRQGR